MTLQWMAYLVVLGTLLAAGAACADAALRAARRPTRLVWAAAIAGTLLLPLAALVRPALPAPPPAPAESPDGGAALAAILARAQLREATAPRPGWERFDRPLIALWGALAIGGLGWLALSRRRLRQLARGWRPAVIDGDAVLVAPDAGPAAVGGPDGGRIILPEWALADDRVPLMLAHERSHLQARDPQLLTAATVAVALAPWNPALWWQLRRLRAAVELDCDRRVLRRYPDVAAYGALLLDVARRDGAGRPRFAAALSAPASTTTLERRIRSMTSRRTRHAAARALALGAAGTALVVAACETPRPTGLSPESRVPLTSITNAAPEITTRDGGVTVEKVRAALAAAMPEVANGSTKAYRVWFVTDASGKVLNSAYDAGAGPGVIGLKGATVRFRADSLKVLAAKNATIAEPGSAPQWMEVLDPASIKSVDVLKLSPGRVAPDSTNVVWITLRKPGARGTDAPSGVTGLGATMTDGEGRFRMSVNDRGEPTRIRAGQPDSTLSARGTTVTVRMTTAAPKAAASAAGPTPLYFVDGVELTGGKSAIDAIDPATIASVSVLKGSAAAQKYGDRGANGVVEITTKKR